MKRKLFCQTAFFSTCCLVYKIFLFHSLWQQTKVHNFPFRCFLHFNLVIVIATVLKYMEMFPFLFFCFLFQLSRHFRSRRRLVESVLLHLNIFIYFFLHFVYEFRLQRVHTIKRMHNSKPIFYNIFVFFHSFSKFLFTFIHAFDVIQTTLIPYIHPHKR